MICLLRSGKVPYVLRQESAGQYRLLGKCYVDGIMFGEAAEGGRLLDMETLFVSFDCAELPCLT